MCSTRQFYSSYQAMAMIGTRYMVLPLDCSLLKVFNISPIIVVVCIVVMVKVCNKHFDVYLYKNNKEKLLLSFNMFCHLMQKMIAPVSCSHIEDSIKRCLFDAYTCIYKSCHI